MPRIAHHARMSRPEDLFDKTLSSALALWDLPMEPSQAERLRAYYQAMIETNRTMNLTRIVDPVEAAIKHFADSLALLVWARTQQVEPRTVLDVGTGAGFPAVPLAIMRSDWSITAIEATKKKIDFVRRESERLDLTNVACHHAHSRHWQPGTTFDLVTFRALARLPEAVEETAGLLATGGRLVAFKTASVVPTEQRDAAESLKRCGLRPEPSHPYTLTCADETLDRVLLVYRKDVVG